LFTISFGYQLLYLFLSVIAILFFHYPPLVRWILHMDFFNEAMGLTGMKKRSKLMIENRKEKVQATTCA